MCVCVYIIMIIYLVQKYVNLYYIYVIIYHLLYVCKCILKY